MNSFSFGSANSSTLSLAPNLQHSPTAAASAADPLQQPLAAAGTGVDRLELSVLGRLSLVGFHRAYEATRRREYPPKGINAMPGKALMRRQVPLER